MLSAVLKNKYTVSFIIIFGTLSFPIVRRQSSVRRPSVRLSVCPIDHNSNGGLQLCCWAPCGQEISIDSCGRRAAGAGAQLQMRAASCWQLMEEAEHRLAFLIAYFYLTSVMRYKFVWAFINEFLHQRSYQWNSKGVAFGGSARCG